MPIRPGPGVAVDLPSQLQLLQLRTTLATANMHYSQWCTMQVCVSFVTEPPAVRMCDSQATYNRQAQVILDNLQPSTSVIQHNFLHLLHSRLSLSPDLLCLHTASPCP